MTGHLIENGILPRALDARLAAEYVSLSPRSFRNEVEAGRFPAPFKAGRRKLWDRVALDRAIENRQSGSNPVHMTLDEDLVSDL